MITCKITKLMIEHATLHGPFVGTVEGLCMSCGLTHKLHIQSNVQANYQLIKKRKASSSDEDSTEEVNHSQMMPVDTHECESYDARSESGNEQDVGNLSLAYFC